MAIVVTIQDGSVTNAMVAETAGIEADKCINRYAIPWTQTGRKARNSVRSESFDIDNGAGTTIDRVLMRPTTAITLTAGRILYEDATTGTVAGANVKIGTTVGGAELVAATAYADGSAVGTKTALAFAATAVAADTPVIIRHTGIAATAAGRASIELEYTVNLDSGTVYDETVEIHLAQFDGVVRGIAVACTVAPTSTTSFTVDLKKGSSSASFATMLSSAVSYTSSRSNKEVATGTISGTGAYLQGDILQLVITTTAGSGVQATGLAITVFVDEEGQ